MGCPPARSRRPIRPLSVSPTSRFPPRLSSPHRRFSTVMSLTPSPTYPDQPRSQDRYLFHGALSPSRIVSLLVSTIHIYRLLTDNRDPAVDRFVVHLSVCSLRPIPPPLLISPTIHFPLCLSLSSPFPNGDASYSSSTGPATLRAIDPHTNQPRF